MNLYMHLSAARQKSLGLALSGLGHVALAAVAFVLLAHPRVWDATTRPVMVDLVPENEAAKVKPEPKQGLPADQQQQAGDAAPKPAPSAPAPSQPAGQQRAAQESPQAQSATPAEPRSPSGTPPGSAPWPTMQGAPATTPSFFALNVPGFDSLEYDAPTDVKAALTPEQIGALHAQLAKCWHPPAALAGAPKLRAQMRIALTPTGALARDPLLVRASASAEGPLLVQAATRALQECQPFSFLPAERYQEWKLLDLTFGPQGLAGG